VERRFFNPDQPQTIQGAVFLLYANVVFALLFRGGRQGLFGVAAYSLTRGSQSSWVTLAGTLLAIFVVVGSAAAGYLIANDRRVGWRLGVVVAALPVAALVCLVTIGSPRISLIDAINGFAFEMLFDAALLALLLHNQTRSYDKIWFK